MSQTSPRLALPFIQPSQAQKHVTHNEALERLDLIVQLGFEAIGTDTPPATPAEGQVWALGAAPTGDWSGQAGQIAAFAGGGWLFVAPQTGWIATSQGAAYIYDGTDWTALDTASAPATQIGINTGADAINRLSVAAEATLFTHDGAGHQVKVNKAGPAETASLLFQSNWSGRAEMGLAGSDAFTLKLSADGSTWTTALAADSTTVTLSSALQLTPGAAPTTPAAGTIYFDDTTLKLRCFDGTTWQDLY